MGKLALVVFLLMAAPVISEALSVDLQEDDILAIIQQVDTNELYRFDKTIQDFGPHPTESDACQAVAAFIYDEFESYGLDVFYEPWDAAGMSSRNVVATLPGETNYSVIISAHYDSVESSPGADDDGSGISVVLMAAQILSQYRFQHTIKFIAYSGEEQGLYGSTFHARQAYLSDERILAVLQLDGVGHAASRVGGSAIRFCANEASSYVSDIGEEVLDAYGHAINLTIHRHGNFAVSDHQSFINYGYRGVFLWEYEPNPHYHSPNDTIEHVNFSYLTKVAKLSIATLAFIADRDVPLYVWLEEPERGIMYFGDRPLMVLDDHRIIVLGHTHAQATAYASNRVDRIEFYLDGNLRGTVNASPFVHTFTKIAVFNHFIKAVAHCDQDHDINEITVTMFNLIPGF